MKKLFFSLLVIHHSLSAYGAANTNALLSPTQYNMMEPHMNDTMREKLKPRNAEYASNKNQLIAREASAAAAIPLSNFAGTPSGSAGRRRVVARNATASTRTQSAAQTQARAASTQSVQPAGGNSSRRVVSRARAGSRLEGSMAQQRNTTAEVPVPGIRPSGEITAAQCLSNYTECMDNYCRRPSTKYDRCYCSAKLTQLDAEYKPAIDALAKQIVILQNGGDIVGGMSQEEINEYWNEMFGAAGWGNSMENLDNALNIEWAGTESSVRGQNAFVAGDNYCKQNLAGCYYMADNMKSMYRTVIGQDCKKYETNLQKLKYAAEQAVRNMQ